MLRQNDIEIDQTAVELKDRLKKDFATRGLFWSYDTSNLTNIPDSVLIEKAFIYGDLDQLDLLKKIYQKQYLRSQVDRTFSHPSYQRSKDFVLLYLFGER